MFQRRLAIFIFLVILATGGLIARLYQLQIIQGPYYDQLTKATLERPGKWLETVRGQILDAQGRILATDVPQFDLCLNYTLTRLYDERFWEGLAVRYFSDSANTTPEAAVRRCLMGAFGYDRITAEAFLARHHPAELNTIRQAEIVQADQLLGELAGICQVGRDVFLKSIREINDDIYLVRMAVARRKAYQRRYGADWNNYFQPKELAEIPDDFAAVMPDPVERLKLIADNPIREMNQPLPILPGLSEDAALTVEEYIVGKFPGSRIDDRPASIQVNKMRSYPYQDAACHLMGQIRPVRANEVSTDTPDATPSDTERSALHLGNRTGDWGVEYLFEEMLRGRRGWSKENIDPGKTIRIEPEPGQTIQLTIDIELQRAVQKVLENPIFLSEAYYQSPMPGAAVVLDVPTGRILAMVSVPGFDLNNYYFSQNYLTINDSNDPRQRKFNHALSVNYQPGSTIKPTVLLAALECGIVGPQTKTDCSVANKYWTGLPADIENHGWIDTSDAIMRSCNYFFILTGDRLGSKRMVEWLERSGFNRQILGVPAEVAERQWAAFHETTGHIAPIGREIPGSHDLRFISIGRGSLDASVLQMANSVATIARNGRMVRPSLIISPNSHPEEIQIASAGHAQIVQQAMERVIYSSQGTAYDAFSPPPWPMDEVLIFGKTGTTKWSAFICGAKSSDGRCIAVAVAAEAENAHGAEVAAPIARKILEVCGKYNYLPQGHGQ